MWTRLPRMPSFPMALILLLSVFTLNYTQGHYDSRLVWALPVIWALYFLPHRWIRVRSPLQETMLWGLVASFFS